MEGFLKDKMVPLQDAVVTLKQFNKRAPRSKSQQSEHVQLSPALNTNL